MLQGLTSFERLRMKQQRLAGKIRLDPYRGGACEVISAALNLRHSLNPNESLPANPKTSHGLSADLGKAAVVKVQAMPAGCSDFQRRTGLPVRCHNDDGRRGTGKRARVALQKLRNSRLFAEQRQRSTAMVDKNLMLATPTCVQQHATEPNYMGLCVFRSSARHARHAPSRRRLECCDGCHLLFLAAGPAVHEAHEASPGGRGLLYPKPYPSSRRKAKL